jgi:hypothetical protein
MIRFLCSILLGLTLVFSASLTSASQSHGGGSIAALLGYGVTTGNNANLLGPGLGFRAGYSCPCGLYAGALTVLHVGSHDPGEPEARHRAQSLRAELGYEFWIAPVTLRPTLRVGAAWVKTVRDVDGHFVSPDLGLGLTLLVPIDRWFIGVDADARYLSRLVQNGDNLYVNTTLASYLTAGLAF